MRKIPTKGNKKTAGSGGGQQQFLPLSPSRARNFKSSGRCATHHERYFTTQREKSPLEQTGTAEWSYYNIFLQDISGINKKEKQDDCPALLTYSDYLTLGLLFMHQKLIHGQHIQTNRVWTDRNYRQFCNQVTKGATAQ